MEQVFFRLHAKFVTTVTRLLSPQARQYLEYITLANAVCLLLALTWLHKHFVNPRGQGKVGTCLPLALDRAGLDPSQLHILQIHLRTPHDVSDSGIVGDKGDRDIGHPVLFSLEDSTQRRGQGNGHGEGEGKGVKPDEHGSSNLDGTGTRSRAGAGGSPGADAGSGGERGAGSVNPVVFYSIDQGTGKDAVGMLSGPGTLEIERPPRSGRGHPSRPSDIELQDNTQGAHLGRSKELSEEHVGGQVNQGVHETTPATAQNGGSRGDDVGIGGGFTDDVYLYSLEKGFLMLRPDLREKHGIMTANVTISVDDSCIGGKVIQALIKDFVGYDTVVMNWLISLYGGQGFLYSVQNNELFNLNYAAEFLESTENLYKFLVFKVGVLFTTLFLFFTTTTLVSVTLRETQERMLKFTFLLQHHVRNRLPYAPLVFTHVVESLVFVPIMVGILFFLFEFFSDQLLAFMVLSVVWLCEVYSVISVRTTMCIRFFPQVFFLYFTLFHIYFFSFPFGFSYLALMTTVLFLEHSMLFFWNRYEVPALQSGTVSAAQPRQSGMITIGTVPNPEIVLVQGAADGGEGRTRAASETTNQSPPLGQVAQGQRSNSTSQADLSRVAAAAAIDNNGHPPVQEIVQRPSRTLQSSRVPGEGPTVAHSVTGGEGAQVPQASVGTETTHSPEMTARLQQVAHQDSPEGFDNDYGRGLGGQGGRFGGRTVGSGGREATDSSPGISAPLLGSFPFSLLSLVQTATSGGNAERDRTRSIQPDQLQGSSGGLRGYQGRENGDRGNGEGRGTGQRGNGGDIRGSGDAVLAESCVEEGVGVDGAASSLIFSSDRGEISFRGSEEAGSGGARFENGGEARVMDLAATDLEPVATLHTSPTGEHGVPGTTVLGENFVQGASGEGFDGGDVGDVGRQGSADGFRGFRAFLASARTTVTASGFQQETASRNGVTRQGQQQWLEEREMLREVQVGLGGTHYGNIYDYEDDDQVRGAEAARVETEVVRKKGKGEEQEGDGHGSDEEAGISGDSSSLPVGGPGTVEGLRQRGVPQRRVKALASVIVSQVPL
ncbi:unnamed protein product [Discosporangium mesarthrocarpum]